MIRKPTTVTVQWTEADPDLLRGDTTYDFIEFECLARLVARRKGSAGGYEKTKVTVAFDDGDTYECRLDLAEHDTHGFAHHVRSYLAFAETERGREYLRVNPALGDCLDFQRTIEFPA